MSNRRCGGTASPDGCTSASAAGSERPGTDAALRGSRPRYGAQERPRAAHQRHGLFDRRLRGSAALAPAIRAAARSIDEVLIRDELVAVALHDHARERPAADDEDLLVVLLQLFDERDEVAVAA